MNQVSKVVAAGSSAGNVRGIAWMFLTGIIFVFVTGIVRHLGSDMHPIQAAFIRYAIGLAFLAPLVWRELRRRGATRRRYDLHAIRGVVHALGIMLWFYAMARIPVAEVTALGFTAPIFTTIGAALFLGEKMYARRITAVIVGFLGTLIILRPGLHVIDPGAIAQIVAAPLFAASLLITKKLTESE
ncbi:MAG: DMT family transporter, partial [Alphaproteobacteria bacterium]|nr:DMT family transporter [Alphaproteobacteria bacterium]